MFLFVSFHLNISFYREGGLFSLSLNSQNLEQSLAHCRYSIYIEQMNG